MHLYYIDLFCGAGGVTQGIETSVLRAKKVASVLACVNHNAAAIKSHALNHPECAHFTEDVRTLDVSKLLVLVEKVRAKEPKAIIILWASLECTHFSPARGAVPMLDDSRTLALSLYKYVDILQPDYIHIENVRAFLDWGPLDKNNLPNKKLKGTDYLEWSSTLKNKYGYVNHEHKVFNSANFGVPQTRVRLFIQFSKELPIVWPKETHTKETWEPVAHVLDLNERGENIFTRKKPYCERTLTRIYRGLIKHDKEKNFITKYYKTGTNVSSIKSPAPTLTTKDRLSLISVDHFIRRDDRTGIYGSISKPVSALTTVPKHCLVEVQYLLDDQYNNVGRSVTEPAPTIISRQDKKPLHLISASKGNPELVIKKEDSPVTIDIKNYMLENNITAIYSRLLSIPELLRIMGIPKDYKFDSTKTQAKEFIGNAVTPIIPKLLAITLYKRLLHHYEIRH